MAAAHSTPTVLATATLRSRNSPSGMSGESTRDSITRNTPSSSAATPSMPSVCADVQPSWLPLTIA